MLFAAEDVARRAANAAHVGDKRLPAAVARTNALAIQAHFREALRALRASQPGKRP